VSGIGDTQNQTIGNVLQVAVTRYASPQGCSAEYVRMAAGKHPRISDQQNILFIR